MAAASRSLGRFMPATSAVTYAILTLSCLLFFVSLLMTISENGFQEGGGGLSGLFNFGGISGDVLQRLGASMPLGGFPGYPGDLAQPWRLVTAIFLHGSILHILFNMWVLMDIGPQVEELYGSARYLFIYVVTGIGGYALSSFLWRFSMGGSGALLGLIGMMLATTIGRRAAGMQMLRQQLIRLLIYIAIWGIVMPGIDNWAHAGGFVTGFLLGKIMTDRPPATPQGTRLAYTLGWIAGLAIIASFAMALLNASRGHI